ncbi:cysteine-rich with EGF-like domain protein 2 isoform X1 [Mobula birostris]|uniref:cysteine-rich with EGF-like domain protein 2 isoform X1 n=1 Tax=Mobula birostris TaxID=1983395 RepID=UPI003B281740
MHKMDCRSLQFVLVGLLVLCGLSSSHDNLSCSTCKKIGNNFLKGVENTSRKNFGGGNTDWEERYLSKYEISETRLVEIMESLCENSEFECHLMVETNEDHIERWWFTMQKEHSDFFHWFCVDTIKVCCPAGSFGVDCDGCPGGMDKPCSGHGTCDGDGTRAGDGSCSCTKEYKGPECLDCADGYYSEFQNETDSLCTACHPACKTCSGPSNHNCSECANGWVETVTNEDGVACDDIDECAAEIFPCKERKYCSNTEGSYSCEACHNACDACTGEGPESCLNCTTGYSMEGSKCVDINECSLAEEVCTRENEDCVNTEGSFECACTAGYENQNGVCVEVKTPAEVEMAEEANVEPKELADDALHEDL